MAMGSGAKEAGSIFRFDTRQIVVAGIIGGIALFLGSRAWALYRYRYRS